MWLLPYIDQVLFSRCGHEFHASCIIPWIFSEPPIEANHPVATQLCPLCRFPLSLDISESMEECTKLLRDASLPFYRVSTPAVSTERRIETIASSRRTSHIRHILGFPLPVAEPVRSGSFSFSQSSLQTPFRHFILVAQAGVILALPHR